MALNIDATFKGKLTCAFKNDMRNLVNFHQSAFESLKIWTFIGAMSKTWKPRKSPKSLKFFSEIFKSEFSILALGQNQKLGNKKTRNTISEIFEVFGFLICHFFMFFLNFFKFFYKCFLISLFYICNYSSTPYFINIVRLSH